MEVRKCTICLAIFSGDIPWSLGLNNRPYINRYLQFRFLEFPLIITIHLGIPFWVVSGNFKHWQVCLQESLPWNSIAGDLLLATEKPPEISFYRWSLDCFKGNFTEHPWKSHIWWEHLYVFPETNLLTPKSNQTWVESNRQRVFFQRSAFPLLFQVILREEFMGSQSELEEYFGWNKSIISRLWLSCLAAKQGGATWCKVHSFIFPRVGGFSKFLIVYCQGFKLVTYTGKHQICGQPLCFLPLRRVFSPLTFLYGLYTLKTELDCDL